ncbi:hypothetical protein GCM10008097_08210 [Mycetocola manganoxydans]|nr:hypothetical protein GCM10008097_08210 [Mycetocola manganoxydans]
MATPVMRCSTQDHMPSRPRYSVPAGRGEVVESNGGVLAVFTDNERPSLFEAFSAAGDNGRASQRRV